MAKRGRKPLTPRTSPGGRPWPASWDCPPHLSGDAEAAWGHVVGLLSAAGNLDRTDPSLVEAYALNVAALRDAQRAIEEDGVVIRTGRGGVKGNPAFAVLNSASMRIKAIVEALGLCPASSKFSASKPVAQPAESKWGDSLSVVG